MLSRGRRRARRDVVVIKDVRRSLRAKLFAPLLRAARDIIRPPTPSPRVLRAIRDAERDAVIVVGWIQLVGVAVFFALFLSTRAAYHQDARPLGPTPLALGAYGAFVFLRLRRAYADRLTARLSTMSIVADVVILMTLIWSFTLQYEKPAALYLKAPTLFYAFILIALPALRFDAGHVMLAGALVIAGWIILVLIAAGGARVAVDYPDYMTSLSVFWGAEAEKIAALLAVTLILALAVARSRALLVRTSVEEAAAHDLSRLVSAGAARRVRSGDGELRAGEGELLPTAIMFIDLRGFSAAAQTLSADEVVALLQDYQRCFVPVLTQSGGVIDKYLGDGILVSFTSAPAGREAAMAFAAAAKVLLAWEGWAEDRAARGATTPHLGVAITQGDVIHGVVGDEDRLEFTIIGDAVNLAAKLEKKAKALGATIIATEAAYAAAQSSGYATPILRAAPQTIVEGVNGLVDLVIVA